MRPDISGKGLCGAIDRACFVEIRQPAIHQSRHIGRGCVFYINALAVHHAGRSVEIFFSVAHGIERIHRREWHDSSVKSEKIFACERAADHFVDQVDRPRMPVNLLMIPQRLASDGEAEFQNFDGFAESQSIALDGCGFVRPLGSESLEKLIAEIVWKSLIKKASLARGAGRFLRKEKTALWLTFNPCRRLISAAAPR